MLPSTTTQEKIEPNRKGELHFFIIWEHGRHKEKEIVADIGKHFKILGCYDILWSPSYATSNFARLYGVQRLSGWRLARKRGAGRFLLITVWDENPVYELAEALTGFECLNTNMLKLKKLYRSWTDRKGINGVHSSIRPEETNWNLTLILGKNADDYLASINSPWDGSFEKIDKDILGAHGWNSLEEAFYALNNTVNYAVLRNFEGLPHNFDPSIHKDIDLLTDERNRLISVLNPRKTKPLRSPVQLKVSVDGKLIDWDVRQVGDDYYCLQWEQDMLQDKVLTSENVYVLNGEHHFYSLIYHALVHKKRIAADYYEKAKSLMKSLCFDLPNETFSRAFDMYFELLKDYMKRRNYVFCSPQAARYNKVMANLHSIAGQLEKKFGLSRVKPIRLASLTGIKKSRQRKCRTYYQGWLEGKKIFIKHFGPSRSHKKEFSHCSRLNKVNPNNFPEAVLYSKTRGYRCVAHEFIEGVTLKDKMASGNFSLTEKTSLVIQLKEIAKSLMEAGVVHRNIHSDNLMVTEDDKWKLIGFGRSVNVVRHKESVHSKKKTSLLMHLREYLAQWYRSGDTLSLLKVLEEVGCQDHYQEAYCDTEAYLKKSLGKASLRHLVHFFGTSVGKWFRFSSIRKSLQKN